MTERDLKPANIPHLALAVPCTICNAKIGEVCSSILSSNVRETPHARRIEAARKND